MLARVFTLRFDSVLEGFDDRPLRDFLKDKEVVSLREHFFTKNEIPYLAVFITYQLQPVAAQAVVPESRNQREASWRELVSEAEVPLFNTLRDWRAERCKREGIPPYVLCTNKQLAALVKARPQSLAALGEVEGFGKAKLDKYGRDILTLLAPAVEQQVTNAATVHEGTNHERPE